MEDPQPDKARHHVERAKAYLNENSAGVPKAISHLQRAAVLAPDWLEPHRLLGDLMLRTRRWGDSIVHNSCALDLAPDRRDLVWRLGIASAAAGRQDDASSAWQALGVDDRPPDQVGVKLALHAHTLQARTVDPATARLTQLPPPESGLGFDDLILIDQMEHVDGLRDDRIVHYLDVLERGGYLTFEARVEAVSQKWIRMVDSARRDHGKVACLPARKEGQWRLMLAAKDLEEAHAAAEILLSRDPVTVTSPFRETQRRSPEG